MVYKRELALGLKLLFLFVLFSRHDPKIGVVSSSSLFFLANEQFPFFAGRRRRCAAQHLRPG